MTKAISWLRTRIFVVEVIVLPSALRYPPRRRQSAAVRRRRWARSGTSRRGREHSGIMTKESNRQANANGTLPSAFA
ncbi:hypothetical protein [Cohnella thermotolerans]|uniref:hypothetical protein n=1 Tax=Cohnella thermotolerans TaxID=329858 RepID=UPI0003F5B9CD|nr:hypothetical protein [Cohnella thermotolerans]